MTEKRGRTVSCPYCGTFSVVNVSEMNDFLCPTCGSKAVLSDGGTTILIESGTIEDSLIGSKLGGYRIERLIGSGGMGRVYYAVQETVDRAVALKVLSPSLTENQSLRNRFIMEAKAAGRLLHPHIVTVFDAGEVEGTAFIAMEYVDGISLAQKIFENGRLSVEEALEIGRQIATALSYAHTCKVIHRDIKPANILIRNDGVAKLADMGLAKRLDMPGVTMPGAVMGTPFYMAPEQAVDSASVDHRADIYSLGATLYHTVVGRVPFGGASTIEVLAKQKMETLQFPKDAPIPQGMRNLITRMMAKEPDKRYQSWEEVIAVIDELSGKRREPSFMRRMVKAFIFIAAVLVVLLAFLFAVHMGGVEDRVKEAERFYRQNPDSSDEALRMFFELLPDAAATPYLSRVLSGAKTAFQSLVEQVERCLKDGDFQQARDLLKDDLDGLGIPEAEKILQEREKLKGEIESYQAIYEVHTFHRENLGKNREVLMRYFELLPTAVGKARSLNFLFEGAESAFEGLKKQVIRSARRGRFREADRLLEIELKPYGFPRAKELLKRVERLRYEVGRYRALYKRLNDLLMAWQKKNFRRVVDFVEPSLRKSEDVRRGLFVAGLVLAFSELRSFRIGLMKIEGDHAQVSVEMEIIKRPKNKEPIRKKISNEIKFIYKNGKWYMWIPHKPPMKKHPPRKP